jgi:hypothetical protein
LPEKRKIMENLRIGSLWAESWTKYLHNLEAGM